MGKWVAVNEMVMVRVKNPNPAGIILSDNADITFPPEGILVNMGYKAVEALSPALIDCKVRFTGQMQRECFGKPEDEFYYVVLPYTAIVAVLDETDEAASH